MPNRPFKYRHKPRLIAFFGLLAVLVMGLGACGEGAGTASTGTGAGAGAGIATPTAANTEFLVRYMKEWYLWNDRIPADASASQYANQADALAKLRVAEDKFSGISTEADFNSFFTAGQLTGYGISYLKIDGAIVLQQVQPLSPAYTAGFRRGDEILSIDGKSIAEMATTEDVSKAIGPNEAGINGSFQVRTPNLNTSGFQTTKTVVMTKASYPVSYVFAANTLNSTAGKVGYIHFYSFTGTNQSAWNSALSKIMSEGAQHLILDLRDNTGGVVNDSVLLASSLGPKNSSIPGTDPLNGKLAVRLEHNAQKKASDFDYNFSTQAFSGRIGQLVIITSAKTCSASEIVIQALKPFRTVKTVGSTTCGKPYGSTPTTFGGFVYSILSFQNKNSAGEGAYTNGLTPTCLEEDHYLRSMGDPQERLLVAARQLIETGNCPDSALLPKDVLASRTRGSSKAQWAFWRGIEQDSGFQ
jgi:carboxyl-terminal processing protease